MLVTFKTKAYSDITLFGYVAVPILKKMGHSGVVPGAILATDVPIALTRLLNALDSEEAFEFSENNDSEKHEVSMAHRSLPLINLLKAAVEGGCDVMWE